MRALVRPAASVLALLALGASGSWASDPPYAGSWKLNPAMSDFGETTVTYEQMADGQIKVTGDGQSYTFRADGKDYPTPWGVSTAWKAVGAHTWEVAYKVDAKVTGTAVLKLGADGKTMTVDARNIDATGKAHESTAVYQRLSGGPGLVGTWKTKNVQISSPGTISIRPSESDGVTLTFVEQKGTCSAELDGTDSPATGPVWPTGWTCAISKKGANALDVTWKKDGKVMSRDTLTPSADGKTLTHVAAASGTTEKVKAVYDRQ